MFNHANHIAKGTILGFLGSLVSLPTGILTAAFLTRRLGPEDYGLLTVTATLIVWVEVIITMGFNRSAVKFISETPNWVPVSTRLLQAQSIIGFVTAIVMIILAPAIASLLNAPEMALYIRVYSLGIPIVAFSGIHKSVLIGLGHYKRRAFLNAMYWIFRMVFIFSFVGIQPTVTAAVLANICATTVVLIGARYYVRPPLFARSDFPVRNIWDYAWPLFFFTVGMNLFGQLDLIFIKALCDLPETTGYYGAAKNLTILPALFSASLAPLLVGKLALLSRQEQHGTAQVMSRESLRFVICLLPFAGMASGSATEIVTAIYGRPFLPSASFLSLLIFAALGVSVISVTASTLIAAGRPELNLILICPLVGLTLLLLFILVPRFGAMGAVFTTTVLAWFGAIFNMLIVTCLFAVLHTPLPIYGPPRVCCCYQNFLGSALRRFFYMPCWVK